MKALTVRPPWAWALIYGGKDVENRTWSTKYRGPIAIHAGQRRDRFAEQDPLIVEAREKYPTDRYLELGMILGVVGLFEVHEAGTNGCTAENPCSPWAQFSKEREVFHWRVMSPMPVEERLRASGALGLWIPSDDTSERLQDVWAGR